MSPSPSPKKPRFESPKKNSKPLDYSEHLLNKVKQSRFHSIFTQLLPNTKGLITSETVYKAGIDTQLKSILKPIFYKIEKESVNFSETEFFNEIELVFKQLTPGDKALLLRTNKKVGECCKKVPARSSSVNMRKEINKALTFSNFPIKLVN